jgi:hypothetical protein
VVKYGSGKRSANGSLNGVGFMMILMTQASSGFVFWENLRNVSSKSQRTVIEN